MLRRMNDDNKRLGVCGEERKCARRMMVITGRARRSIPPCDTAP